MPDPTSATTIPHIVGILLDSNGVAYSQVTATNRTTGESVTNETDGNKRVIFNLADLPSGYSNGDVIEFNNSGGSLGGTTLTTDTGVAGFQNATITCTAMISTSLSM